VAGFEKTAKTPRAGRFPPPRRSPGRRSRLGLLTALDAARCPSPPRPPRCPRRRRRPFLRQSRDRRPCFHDLASSTAVRQLGFVAQTKKPAIHRCLLPRSRSGRHSCRPARAPVPAALHRRPPHGPSATAPPRQLSVDTRRPCTCNQRPSTRSHRTVDNSLITARRRYSTFLKKRRERTSAWAFLQRTARHVFSIGFSDEIRSQAPMSQDARGLKAFLQDRNSLHLSTRLIPHEVTRMTRCVPQGPGQASK